MKAKVSSFERVAIAAVHSLIALAVFADVGGGSGRPITPYKSENPSEAEVVEMQRRAAGMLAVRTVRLANTNASKSGYNVGLVYVQDGATTLPAPKFALSGVDEGGTQREILLANMASLRLLSVEGKLIGADEATLEVTEFPVLTPKDLLKLKPTYSTLREKHTKKVKLKVPLESDGELWMIGTGFFGQTNYRKLFRIRDLKPNLDVTFDPDLSARAIWWAIPSVIADKAYPHRAVMKR